MARQRMEKLKVKPKKAFRDGKWRAWVHGPKRRTK